MSTGSGFAAGPPLLGVEDLTVRFGGVTALEGVSLEVRSGEAVGVIGPNGAGKTTLFNAICGFVRPQQGRIAVEGKVQRRIRPHQLARLGIGRTLQGVGLFSGLTVLENVMVGAQRFHSATTLHALVAAPRAERDLRELRRRAVAALERLGCAELADRYPDALPYAFQKRVAIARCLAGEPRLLLLDEPAGGLDGHELEELAALLGSLRGEVAIVLVDHNVDFVARICERVVVLDFGRVICTGTPEEVRRDPRVAEAYLGAAVEEGVGAEG